MDRDRFDALARLLATKGSRRGALGALLGAAFFGHDADEGVTKRDKRRAKRPGKDRSGGKSKDRQQRNRASAEAIPARCCGRNFCPKPSVGSNAGECNFAAQDLSGRNMTSVNFGRIDGRGTNFNNANVKQANFGEACLQGATFRGANVRQTNWHRACLFGADFTGAINLDFTVNFATALLCGTILPDGTVVDRDCARATTCCAACESDEDCDGEQICCNGRCVDGECCVAGDCDDRQCQTKACVSNDCEYTPVENGPGPLCNTICCDGVCCDPGEECVEGQCVTVGCTGPCTKDDDCRTDIPNCVCDEARGVCCTRDCTDRECGSDGCGGSCGTCPVGQTCNDSGQCVVACGTDTCDPETEVCCSNGQVFECVTGICCQVGDPCTEQGQCCDTTANDTNCVNGVCCIRAGSVCTETSECCGNNLTCCPENGDAICVNTNNDENNCGECGNVCPSGTICQAGVCICPFEDPQGACDPAETCCDPDGCVDTSSDPDNCGECNLTCEAPDLDCCDSQCVDTRTDEDNCGICGNECEAPNATCCPNAMGVGTCVNTLTDENNCGGCGNVCGVDEECINGACGGLCGGISCPAQTPDCCDDVCVNLDTDEDNCGACDVECPNNLVCLGGVCGCEEPFILCGDVCVQDICCRIDQGCNTSDECCDGTVCIPETGLCQLECQNANNCRLFFGDDDWVCVGEPAFCGPDKCCRPSSCNVDAQCGGDECCGPIGDEVCCNPNFICQLNVCVCPVANRCGNRCCGAGQECDVNSQRCVAELQGQATSANASNRRRKRKQRNKNR